jgi:ATP-dependent helicase/nuclease subunit A
MVPVRTNAEDRLLNLEALRGLVAAYQEDRQRNRAPTTATDLCAWLAEQEAAQPESRAENAVTVLTYHGSKGLEWPLVVLTDLDAKPKASAFGLHLASDVAGPEIDWNDPLAGRWLRFWPWPFGAQKKDVALDATAANSEEGKKAARAEREERARLLYVGATRARDYLVLALPKSKTNNWAWLDELRSDSGERRSSRQPSGTARSRSTAIPIRFASRRLSQTMRRLLSFRRQPTRVPESSHSRFPRSP